MNWLEETKNWLFDEGLDRCKGTFYSATKSRCRAVLTEQRAVWRYRLAKWHPAHRYMSYDRVPDQARI